MIPARKLLLLISLSAIPALAEDPSPQIDPERVRWVAEHAVAVRSIDPADEDFSDLMPLVQVIGKARVVQLGEATHGDGATFLAKGRLIRFLHQVMGFDVLAWESGFFDVRRLDAALRGGLPSAEAARRGLYLAWQNQETMATLEYVRASQGTDRPIDVVGFDCRVSRDESRAELFPKMVFDFFDRLDPSLISKNEREDFTTMSVGLLPADYYYKPGLRSFNRELPRRLVETIDRRRAELVVHFPPREIDYVRQSLVSFLAMDRALGPGDKPAFSQGYTRDTAMAENLLWWLNGPLKERKVVVWAHNYHVMNDLYLRTASPGVAPVREAKSPIEGGPMGRFLKDELGSDLYTIGFDSHGGSTLGEEGKDVPVVPGFLETLLHAAGLPLLFLDLSRLPTDHWLRSPLTGSFYFHEPHPANWSRVFDGIFFVDTQKPARPLPK
ncbi:MAG TPA: erythromycin esterase family protein [Thermoanaerobaculia bacterium]|nr:erythromycin esterase family protein [Thermoanaerobaculia bacterium]